MLLSPGGGGWGGMGLRERVSSLAAAVLGLCCLLGHEAPPPTINVDSQGPPQVS